MKRAKNYTFIIAGDGSSGLRRFTVGKKGLFALVGMFFVFLFSFALLLTAYFSLSVDQWTLSQLKRENQDLRASLSSSSQKLETLEKKVYKISDFSEKLQLIVNAPFLQANESKPVAPAGWGGAHSPTESLMALSAPISFPWRQGNGRGNKRVYKGAERSPASIENSFETGELLGMSQPPLPPTFIEVKEGELELRVEKLDQKSELVQEDIWTLYSNLLAQKEILDRTPSRQPVLDGWISSGFGYRDETFYSDHEPDFHRGVDFAAMEGSAVIASADGKVVYTGYDDEGFGNLIILDHGYGVRTYYAHLAEIYVQQGQNIKKGGKIAGVGSTGKSTGPHLHYEVRIFGVPVNPENYILDQSYFHLTTK